ncbi:MAG TPA: class I adenylate-forming enzyme family protein [Nitriliruptorales bacterium]|nr:class I adenylate-forming enzyme family protein [Nitriliruptorales bacterium]
MLEALVASCERHADRLAIVAGDVAWTYRQLLDEVLSARDMLDRFGGPYLLMPRNTPPSVALLLGGIAGRGIPLLADAAWSSAELTEMARRCGAGYLITDTGPPVGFDRVSTRDATPGTAFGRFSSGSTGRSRCLEFSEDAALAAASGWCEAAGLTEQDRVLCLATLNNGLAFNASLLCVFLAGATLGFHPGRLLPRSIARTIDRFRPSVMVAFPFVYEQLAAGGPVPTRGLRLAVSSSARLERAVADCWRAAGLPICDYYGLVEVGPCTFNNGSRTDSVGTLLPHVDCRVEGDGRIRLRSPSMSHGYLDEGPLFADQLDADGYYVTADLGTLTAEHQIVLHGRVGRVVNVAGRKIDPAEIEDVLRTLDGVTDAVVRAEESASRQVLAAYVESAFVGRADVVGHCVARLTPYKVPQLVTVVPVLPRSSSGKVMLSALPRTGGHP